MCLTERVAFINSIRSGVWCWSRNLKEHIGNHAKCPRYWVLRAPDLRPSRCTTDCGHRGPRNQMCHLLSGPCCSGTSRVPNFILALRQFSRRERDSAKPSTWKGGNAFGSIGIGSFPSVIVQLKVGIMTVACVSDRTLWDNTVGKDFSEPSSFRSPEASHTSDTMCLQKFRQWL